MLRLAQTGKFSMCFATSTYAEVESAGPPSGPLGFPAPHVLKSEIASVKYFDCENSEWKEGTALLSGDESDTAYLFTAIFLKQTICGVVMKGIVLQRFADAEDSDPTIPAKNGTARTSIRHNGDITWEKTNHHVAIKVDKRSVMQRIHNGKSTYRNPENPWKEISAMQLLGNEHPHVMGLLGAFSDDQSLYEVMHYCTGGNLSTFIHQNYPHGVPEAQARTMFQQILDGVYYIHSKGVCHHDLSTNNILLDGDENTCIIIDFGMSLRIPYSYPDDPAGVTDDVTDISIGTNRRLIHTNTFCGKMQFVAPEIYQKVDRFDGPAADIWSLGVILFVLLTGKQPYERPVENDRGFHDLNDPSYYWDVTKVDPRLSWGKELSLDVIDLLRNMLCPDPRKRSSLGWVTRHAWIAEETKPIETSFAEKVSLH
jgi:serine/threonine protein kinase